MIPTDDSFDSNEAKLGFKLFIVFSLLIKMIADIYSTLVVSSEVIKSFDFIDMNSLN